MYLLVVKPLNFMTMFYALEYDSVNSHQLSYKLFSLAVYVYNCLKVYIFCRDLVLQKEQKHLGRGKRYEHWYN